MERTMSTTLRRIVFGLSGGILLAKGIAYAQTSFDRYSEAEATLDKATALLNAIAPASNPERKQHDKALADLENARDHIACAKLRTADPRASCP